MAAKRKKPHTVVNLSPEEYDICDEYHERRVKQQCADYLVHLLTNPNFGKITTMSTTNDALYSAGYRDGVLKTYERLMNTYKRMSMGCIRRDESLAYREGSL